jgi:adenylate kinase family enzyme
MKKIIIIGLTGSGKTTLSHKISEKLSLPVFYLDLMFWKEGTRATDDEFTKEQEEIMNTHNEWIIDGGFPNSKSLDVRMLRADTIIFYDLPVIIVFWRWLKRYSEYWNKIRPDYGKKQPFPFTFKDIKYAITYPRKKIYEKISAYKNIKNIYVIRGYKDKQNLLKAIDTLQS